ncbi:hypothetical protein [Streptomyces silaceus]|uniref:hypothetical protein n=1 Tax=Streptomyces silaceus TaxID=545123 RepID=UPI0006EB98E5|nr:hypothetical protein [Streptomyces silaceus]
MTQEATNAELDVAFTNNIVRRGPATTSVNWQLSDSSWRTDHNALYGFAAPAGATHTVTAAPGLLRPGSYDPLDYRLWQGYPTLGSGTPVADNGGRDYFGNPVTTGAAPNIGAYEGPGVPR